MTGWGRRSSSWRRYALRLTKSLSDADDIVQEAVTRTLAAGPRLHNEHEVHRYVLAAVRTSALRMFQRRQRVCLADEVDVGAEPSAPTSAMRLMLDDERDGARARLWSSVRQEMERLSPVQREAIELTILREEQLTLREVAEIQGAPISTVHSRLQSGLTKPARALDQDVAG